MFIIFTPGGTDFVGGYTYYQFLKNSFNPIGDPVFGKNLGIIEFPEFENKGENIHKMIFIDKNLKIPQHWHSIINYY